MSIIRQDRKGEKRAAESVLESKEKKVKHHFPKTLVLGTRGITFRYRHLLNDVLTLLPHGKKEAKMEHKDHLYVLNEIAEVRSCDTCVFFECRKKRDLFMWVSKTPSGPSAKFLVRNVHTMDELKLTGNCLKGSRPLLVFDPAFDSAPHLTVLKGLFATVFNTPKGHPGSKPFIDHVLSFMLADGKIWFRNYQITTAPGTRDEQQLVEIGPRFVLDLVRIFAGSFCGSTLYANPDYLSPNALRRLESVEKAGKYASRIASMKKSAKRAAKRTLTVPEGDAVFGSDAEFETDDDDDDTSD